MALDDYGGQPENGTEDLLDRQVRLQRRLIESVRMGEDMRAFVGTQAGRALMNRAEAQLLEHLTTLLGCADLTSKQAITAHFNARVSVSVLQNIEAIIQEGAEDRAAVEASDHEINTGEDYVE